MIKNKIFYGFKIGVTILVPICIFYYLFKQTDLSSIFQEIRQVSIFIFVITLIISIGNNVLLTAFRWKKILEKIGYNLPYRKVLFVKMGSEPFVGLFPFKSGELSRAVYLKKMNEVNFDDAVFSIGIGYILNFLVLIGYTLIGGVYFYFGATIQSQSQARIIYSVCFMSERFSKNKGWYSRILAEVDEKFNFKKHFCNIGRIVFDRRILLCSGVIWFAELFNFYLLSLSLGVELPFLLICLVIPAVIIISHVPVSIAGLGIREGLIFLWLASYTTPEHLLALGLLYSFVEKIFPIMFGGLATGCFVRKMLCKECS